MRRLTLVLAAVAALTLTACEPGLSEAQKGDQADANQQLDQFRQAQPVPRFNSSQLRQNLIDILNAQANATATTSFFFNLGVPDPIHVCPSVGFPIPGTYQLTNPEQGVRLESGSVTLPLLEASGVYTGDTSATTVICIDADGNGYAHWWEGFVSTVAGPAEWRDGQVVMVGAPTAEFDTGQ